MPSAFKDMPTATPHLYRMLMIFFLAALFLACDDKDDKPVTYRVTFDTDGGSEVTAQTIETGKTATKPSAEPTKTGYTFDDWYADKAFTKVFDFDTTRIVSDDTVFARFTINAYTVSFNTDGGSAITDQPVDYNGNATRPKDPTKQNYTFEGWYTDNTFVTVFDFDNTAITADTEVFAKFTLNTYKVSFNVDNSTVTEQTVTHGNRVAPPSDDPTKSGHYFMGDWYTVASSAASGTLDAAASQNAVANRFDFNTPITGSITLYAFFKTIEQPTGDADDAKLKNLRSLIAKGQADARIGNTGDFNWIDVSIIEDMYFNSSNANPSTFQDNKTFNGDISKWDVSRVTVMTDVFRGAEAFNGDISKWDVSRVTVMTDVFRGAEAFNGDISEWDVSNVIFMDLMFANAKAFNGDISGWNVNKVRGMSSMFSGAASFNRDIGGWNVGSVTDMNFMFKSATSFNQDLSGWDVSKVTSSADFDDGATAWTQPRPNFTTQP